MCLAQARELVDFAIMPVAFLQHNALHNTLTMLSEKVSHLLQNHCFHAMSQEWLLLGTAQCRYCT